MKLAFVLLIAATPAVADPKAKPAPIERIELTARVVEIPKPIYYCGVIAFREVIRYEVISVDKGSFKDKQLFVVELCPERLQVGQKKKLILELPTRSDQGYVDKLPKGPPRYVARSR